MKEAIMAKPENVDWEAVRRDYEETDKPTPEICREHGTSQTTLRDRVWRWGWTPRRLPVPRQGPAPLPMAQVERAAPPSLPLTRIEASAPPLLDAPHSDVVAVAQSAAVPAAQSPPAAQGAAGGEQHAGNDIPTVERLQGAVVAVLANIEAIVAKARTGRTHASENERAARALAALTRTLRELKAFQTSPQEPHGDDTVDDIDEFRDALARKIDAFVATHGGGVRDGAEQQGT
jgi:hypothetical protein